MFPLIAMLQTLLLAHLVLAYIRAKWAAAKSVPSVCRHLQLPVVFSPSLVTCPCLALGTCLDVLNSWPA